MNLKSINIKGFRSIEKSELVNCGPFNVLIGKNNAGKSNALHAIASFFNAIKDGNIVNLDLQIDPLKAFYNRDISRPIEITLVFSLLLAERDALIRDIVTEAPQMKNAADGLDPSLQLSITVSVAPPPTSFAYVSKVELVNPQQQSGRLMQPDRLLFSIGKDTGKELYELLSDIRKHSESAVLIQKVIPDLKHSSRIIESESGSGREGRTKIPLRSSVTS